MRVTKSRAFGRTLSSRFAVAVIASLAATFCVSSAAHAQRGAITLPCNLADLSSNARQIIQGRVVSATVEPDPRYNHLQTLVLTLAVDDVLKGQAPTTFTFREFLWDIRDISDHAGYHLGDEVLLFLNGPTTLGFVAPVGLQRGRFRVVKGADGQDSVLLDEAIVVLDLHRQGSDLFEHWTEGLHKSGRDDLHAPLRKTQRRGSGYGRAMSSAKREANGKVVKTVLTPLKANA
jgi:hypothetical protein